MKILNLFILFFGLSQCDQSHPNENCRRQCDRTEYVALVKCPAFPTTVGSTESPSEAPTVDPTEAPTMACTCWRKGDADEDTACTDLIKQEGPQHWTECHDLAHDYNAITGYENTFFRWEDVATDHLSETYCYFLDVCDHSASNCLPYDGAPCVAGKSDEECEVEETATCPPAIWADEGLHWTCLSKSLKPINPYTVESIQKGTTCQTGNGKDECSAWIWGDGEDHTDTPKVANVICGDSGWENHQELVLNNEVGLIVPDAENADVCICATLEITQATYDTPGLSLVCDPTVYNPNTPGIEYGNGCALLCDNQFMMYVECYKGKWMDTAIYPFTPVTKEDIKC